MFLKELLLFSRKSGIEIRFGIKAAQKGTCSAAGLCLSVLFVLGCVPAVHHNGTRVRRVHVLDFLEELEHADG